MNANDHIARTGAVAGWAALLGILVFEVVGPQVVAGQRVSGTFDAAAVAAYYNHPALEYLSVAVFLAAGAFLVYSVSLREVLSTGDNARFLATVGLGFAVAEVPLIITKSALAATLVRVASSGGDIIPLFRFWDVLYNSGVYLTEAGLGFGFALAIRSAQVQAFPRWLPTLGLVVALLQLVNMTALFTGIPDAVTLVGNIAFALWLGTTSFGLTRLGRRVTLAEPVATS